MLLLGQHFQEISGELRRTGGLPSQRALSFNVSLATASGHAVHGVIHHFASGGMALEVATPLQPGERFGLQITVADTLHTLFCETFVCRTVTAGGYSISAHYVGHETHTHPRSLDNSHSIESRN